MLQNMLDPRIHLAPAIKERIADEAFDIVFLTGIGGVFPFVALAHGTEQLADRRLG